MKYSPITVHQHHGGWEIKDAAGEDERVVGQIIGLADHQTVDVKVESVWVEHDQAVEGARDGKGDQEGQG